MLTIYQIDAFTDRLFSGNPAAVCPLEQWLPDELLQNIAAENNLAETAFYVKDGDQYQIRWFTPAVEVDLCGHATLASAFVLFNLENHPGDNVEFFSPRSGILTVTRDVDLLTLDFPVDTISQVPVSEILTAGFNQQPVEAWRGKTDVMLVFEREQQIRDLVPDFGKIMLCGGRGIIVTAPGESGGFVSRFFAPQSGIPEDPVTGSAHTTLTPYWAQRLGQTEFSAIQLSPRKGYLRCRLEGSRVMISGKAKLFMRGEIMM